MRRLPFDLEAGIYLQAEAALLTGLPRSTVRRWLQLERGKADIAAVKGQPLVSFLDLISFRAVASTRSSSPRTPASTIPKAEAGVVCRHTMRRTTMKLTDDLDAWLCQEAARRGTTIFELSCHGRIRVEASCTAIR